ncbi:hypothetical protein IOQ59_11465 [Pontibacterium sp. N1Y112]|uniref:Uncharacterized protein n=1 Tax=Pontibacterium sinense TaxID=2781979 RepID=A0A8J7KAD9_9GAMM|nr:hypothetical protein [Pontibacterium sinense]MBE9397876.1 hypothetical protein [Pontibacterium sinense]
MKLSDITRTEVFFTGSLYRACENENSGIEKLLKDKLGIGGTVEIIDSSFEVCLFRDFSMAYSLERENKSFEKQTFDNVFVLSDGSIVLVEAKAHQGFDPKQIQQMKKAAEKIVASDIPFNKVYLVGLCSSEYTPKLSTIASFDAVITWKEISSCFNDEKHTFMRADSIYNDRVAKKKRQRAASSHI